MMSGYVKLYTLSQKSASFVSSNQVTQVLESSECLYSHDPFGWKNMVVQKLMGY